MNRVAGLPDLPGWNLVLFAMGLERKGVVHAERGSGSRRIPAGWLCGIDAAEGPSHLLNQNGDTGVRIRVNAGVTSQESSKGVHGGLPESLLTSQLI